MSENNSSTNKPVIILLVVLIVAVLGVGGFLIVRDLTRGNKDADSSQTQDNKTKDGGDNSQTQGGSDSGQAQSDQTQGGSDGSQTQGGDQGGSTPSGDQPASTDIDAGITYAEVRKNDFYIEVQTNGAIPGTCDISLLPTNGGQGHRESVSLEESNKVSLCSKSFSLKGMNPGEYKVTVVINSSDGRTKTLEKVVKV